MLGTKKAGERVRFLRGKGKKGKEGFGNGAGGWPNNGGQKHRPAPRSVCPWTVSGGHRDLGGGPGGHTAC